ncbi:unnamed protein product [Phytophthora fragariaefolia]|uniref:Unnamed protein product n=1 Tax=Phytophthora fragariaefolia TaxID=1490495 RepID=A0A9W6X089_9STRA|nr:unnamed protein product [Phytophthora fragariaefolia]
MGFSVLEVLLNSPHIEQEVISSTNTHMSEPDEDAGCDADNYDEDYGFDFADDTVIDGSYDEDLRHRWLALLILK